LSGQAWYAHSGKQGGRWEPLVEHLALVAERATEFASAFQAGDEAKAAGLVHDLGKYGEAFQRRLRGETHGVDHWSAGAWAALQHYRENGVALALAAQGHHLGLQRGDRVSLRELAPSSIAATHPDVEVSGADIGVLRHRLEEDGLVLPAVARSVADFAQRERAAFMLDVRMLFSALVDADYLETEAHFAAGPDGVRRYRDPGPVLNPRKALAVVERHVAGLSQAKGVCDVLMGLRADLFRACLDAGERPQGLFTLSAPTGAGKTLAMLAFALRHAAEHQLRRIVLVIPYLTIIEQAAGVCRELFQERFGEHFILEHHSLAGTRQEDREGGQADCDNEDEARRRARLLAENWDAPIIVTTSVQFLESLFANRPSACRKLHRVARSVVLFDEVQTLDPRLAVPTLATLSRLSERYGTTVVFATATQPAFTHLDPEVSKQCAAGWRPAEIARPDLGLFGRLHRTRVRRPDPAQRTPWEELAGELARVERRQALCVVNVKRHAVALARALQEREADGLFHLSTSMCPLHRERVLAEVRQRLRDGAPCRLVSTQCVEAGVDVDFPTVYRAWGPLEAIAQAAGRCNRNGRAVCGEVRIFLPPDDGRRSYPTGAYRQAADIARIVLDARGVAPGDPIPIDDPTLFDEYYRALYDLTKIAQPTDGRARELNKAVERRDFAEVARLYRLIPDDGINVLVPYDLDAYHSLAAQVRDSHLSARWMRFARYHTVSLFRPRPDDAVWRFLEPVPIAKRNPSDQWFIYLREEDYDRRLLGLVPQECPDTWIV